MNNDPILHVLSIDFDLFQNVDEDTVAFFYPDGIDLPTDLSSLVWMSRYITTGGQKRMKNITANTKMLKALKNLIRKSTRKTMPDVMICNSHVNIYDFIHSRLDDSCYDGLAIDHLDMHHDMFNDNDQLDCGNWLSYIKEETNTDITWVANPASRELYALEGQEFDIIRTDFEDIKGHTWDMIFLCRSDNWLPPHLDGYFEDFAGFLVKHSTNCQIEDGILKSRWSEKYQNSIAEARAARDELLD